MLIKGQDEYYADWLDIAKSSVLKSLTATLLVMSYRLLSMVANAFEMIKTSPYFSDRSVHFVYLPTSQPQNH
jgi:hypothetical protein